MYSKRCKALLGWYQREARKLPWRETTDPYHIWISEIMLQQTQVKTVLPRYADWFKTFPDIASLATATTDEVLKAWEGLGYYRRARFIHQAANQIMHEHRSIFPSTFETILALPGIGCSTAGAIASVCFDQSTPVLDGNVKRVLKRWHGQMDSTDKQLWIWAQQGIDTSTSPANWNQAMMELGATLCSPQKPDCISCPMNQHCESAFQPVETKAAKRTAIKNVHWQVELHSCSAKGIWLSQRPDTGIWAGLWTPPITELESRPATKPCHIHLLTHRRLHLYGTVPAISPAGDGQWFSNLENIALPTGIHRLLEKHGVTT